MDNQSNTPPLESAAPRVAAVALIAGALTWFIWSLSTTDENTSSSGIATQPALLWPAPAPAPAPAEREHPEDRAKRLYESPRMLKLWKEHRAEGAAAIDRFAREMQGHAPLVEPIEGDARGDVLVTFTWRGQPEHNYLALVGVAVSPSNEAPMQRFEGSDLYFITARLPDDARFTYAFRHGPPWTGAPLKQFMKLRSRMDADPWNPRTHDMGSLVELPRAPAQPWAERTAGVPEGRLVKTSIHSDILEEDRSLGVYLPPGFDPAKGPYPYVIVFDGNWFGLTETLVPTPTILDNLIAKGKVPPMLGVLVDSQGTRQRDLAMSARFGDFLAKELVPWLRREHRASDDPSKATLAGASLGGLGAAYVAFHHADIFGNVLSQSGSFWFSPGAMEADARYHIETGALIKEYRDAPRRPLRVWMEVGLFEGVGALTGGGLLAQNRHMRDILIAKGYDVSYREFSGGHDFACWRGSLADGLISLAGPAAPAPAGPR